MGAQFNFRTMRATTRAEALKEAKEVISQSAYDYGHAGYTGSFAEASGADYNGALMEGEQEAENFLVDKCEKWGPAIIVQDKAGVFYMGAWCSS
jgi:hypothetical protein